jgi:phosphate-selective porin OprO/OprP
MKRVAGGLALAAGLLASGAVARANETGGTGGKSETERRLDEVLAELESQRLEIQSLKSKLTANATPAQGGVEDAVKKYLESEEGQKSLGRGKDDFRAFWKDGLNFETKDKAFAMKIGGRIMFDVLDPHADGDVETARGDFDRSNRFRRARLELGGSMHKNIFYKFEVEFGATPHTFRDMFIGIKDLPAVGNLQVGLMKEPMSLEEMTSSKYITFLERSVVNSMVRAHNPGIMAHNEYNDGRVGWALGLFGDDDGRGAGGGGVGNNISGRIWGTPVYTEKGESLLHAALAFSLRDPEARSDTFSSRGDTSVGPTLASTGAFSVDSSRTLALEMAYKKGPFSTQGEYIHFTSKEYRGAPDFDPTFKAWYLMASYFLTGEERPYKSGSFQRVKPKTNFDGNGGVGAWEVAARFGKLDLDSDSLSGGQLRQVTLGVNWYLNPQARVMLNYGINKLKSVGSVKTIALRFQLEF